MQTKTIINAVLCLFILIQFFVLNQCNMAATDNDNHVFQVLSVAYKKNRDSFTNINCKFKVTMYAKVNSVQQAIDSNYEITQKTVIQEGKLISKDGNTYFERKCSQEDKIISENILKKAFNQKDNRNSDNSDQEKSVIIGGKKSNVTIIPCSDVVLLVSKDLYRLTYSDMGQVANIFPSGVLEGGYGIEFSPFDMGVMARNEYSNPHRYLQACIHGMFFGKYEGTQEINGQQLEVVSISTKDSNNQPVVKLGFDPQRGFLATYIADYNIETHTLVSEAFITETKHCSGDRYFPMRSVVVIPENENNRINNGKYRVNSIEVTELDVDIPPDLNLIQIEIPKGTQVTAPSFKNQWMNIEEEAILVTPQEIEQLHQNCIAYGKAYLERRRAPNFTEPNLKRGMWIKTILIVAGLILIVIGGGNLIRQWKMKK